MTLSIVLFFILYQRNSAYDVSQHSISWEDNFNSPDKNLTDIYVVIKYSLEGRPRTMFKLGRLYGKKLMNCAFCTYVKFFVLIHICVINFQVFKKYRIIYFYKYMITTILSEVVNFIFTNLACFKIFGYIF